MGRYRSPSTCRYCYERGHTKRSCPQMREDAANGNTYAQNVIDRYSARAKSRKCSYCNEGGHNKKGCKTRKAHGVIFDTTNSLFRKEIKERSNAAGIKVGSLVQVSKRGKKVVAIIEKVDIDKRIPTYNWLSSYFNAYGSQQTQEQAQKHSAYGRYASSKTHGDQEPSMFLRSLCGSGLGYWNDSEAAPYGLLDILSIIEKNEDDGYEIVSEA